jgi:hypothetical protein
VRGLVPCAALLFGACGGAPSPVAPHTEAVRAAGAVCAPGEQPIVYLVGGDARDDKLGVLPWAFKEADARGARAFLFLGDMELTPEFDGAFRAKLGLLTRTQLFPVLGNHEIDELGMLNLGFRAQHERAFRQHFLGHSDASAFSDRVVYSLNLAGGVHFVALDNVSQPGFGDAQLAWLTSDLARARADKTVRYVIVGMHKPLVNSIEPHSMAANGAVGQGDSARAAQLFSEYRVDLVVASHAHEYEYVPGDAARRVPPMIITGGLGAPLNSKARHPIHHVMELDVCNGGIDIAILPFPGAARSLMSPGGDEDEHER